jgi:serine/threonine protein kinase
VPETFFDDLERLIHEIHERRIAYVDANKPENILLGDDGRPHLIDFQISWDLHELGDTWINRWWLRRLQHSDIYHVLKHKRRLRPDQMSAVERDIVEKRGLLIQLHRVVTMPYKRVRRSTFKRMRDSGRLLPEGSK